MQKLCFVLILLASGTQVSATVIRLHAHATTSANLVTLGEVAEITETDEVTRQRLMSLTIAPAPARGRELRVTLDHVRRELTLRGIDQNSIQFTGATESLVELLSLPKTSQSKASPANEALQQTLESAAAHAISRQTTRLGEVQVVLPERTIQQLLALAPEESLVHCEIQGGQHPWTGIQQFTMSIVDRQGRTQRVQFSGTVTTTPRALALKHGLARGQVVRAADLIWVEAPPSGRFYSNPDEVIGTETARNLRPETALQAEDIRQLPLVRRNDIVAVRAMLGTVSVKRYCKSQGEGTLGQYVEMIPVDGRERITAKVTGLREAIVEIESHRTVSGVATADHSNISTSVSPQVSASQLASPGLQLITPLSHEQVSPPQNSPSVRAARRPSHSSSQLNTQVHPNQPVRLAR